MQMTPVMVREQLAGMEGRELIGLYVNNILWQRDGKALRLNIIMGRAPMGEVDVAKRKKELLDVLYDPSIEVVDIKGISGAKTRLTFFSDASPPAGLKVYSVSTDSASDSSKSLKIAPKTLENDFYTVSVNDGGTIDILDKQSGAAFNGCLRFVGDGDRGDVYTFDEITDGETVDTPSGPAVVSIAEGGPVRASLKVEVCLHIPEKLVPERDARSSNKIETNITTLVSLYRDIKRIDFHTTFSNQCEDHRLRVHFNAPFAAPSVLTETTFGIVRRSAKVDTAADWFEKPIGTGPQKTFSCVESGSLGMALLNRGIPEIEAIAGNNETALALTLVRAVGWLSREDLKARPAGAGPAIETPGAQSKGPHSFEYAFVSFQGDYATASVVEQAHSFAFPPIGIITNRHKGKIKDGASLVSTDNPNVIVSAIEKSRLDGALLLRLYNTTDGAQQARLALWSKNAKVYDVNLLEKRLSKEPLRQKAGRIELAFRPAEIKTLQVVPGE
jgi:alpha-mannosidase